MKIPFDIKFRPQIESGKYKVETGDKKRVRIICWNRKVNDFPIVALAYDAQRDIEIFINASVLGEPKTDIASERLFIITPEPELSEFEDRVKQLIGCYPNATRENQGSLNYEVRKAAAELLDLARKEALKDLPRWDESQFEMDAPCVNFEWLHVGKKMIYLPDLEKLPGFKE